MAVTNSEAFLQVLKKSSLLSDEELDEISQKYGGEGDPKSIARALIKAGIINKWQALQLLAGRYALTLSKYKLLDQIGSDQKSRVFLAEHTQMGRRVAINTLSRQHAAENPKSVKRFLERASKLAALDHRNVVHVYDVDSEDDRHYVVLEHVEGCSLKQMLDEQGAMPAENAARYVSQAAAGLAYAHKQNHIHGDLRPANLLVDGQDTVKIANLGVKGLTTFEQDEDGEAVSASYVAPEKAAGDQPGDNCSDIYSLGCVMYALLTGHPPSADEKAVEPPSVLDERPDAPESLATVCGRMMASDPAERYQVASEVEQQLDEWLESIGSAKPASARPRASGGAEAASDSHPPKASTPAPRKRAQEKKSPEQQKAVKTPKKRQVAADAPAKTHKTAVAGAKAKKPTKAKSAAGAAGGFAIDTERKRRRKKGKSAAGKGGAVAAADGAESGGIPKSVYIIGGAVAGGLILVTGVILLLVFVVFSGGEGVEVAEAGNGEAGAEGATDAAGTDSDAESDPESDPEVDPEIDPEVDPVMAVETDPEPEPADDTATDGTSQDTGTEATDGDGSSDNTASKPVDEPGSSDAADKADKKGDSPQTKAKDGGTAKAPAAPVTKPAEKKPAEEPAAKKPTPKKPAEKKQPAKPAKKPFEKFPKLVSLPDLNSADAMKPKNLGPIYASLDELCFIKLRGGENAAKGPQRFVMRNADGGLAERDWEIFWREGESGPETKIAHLSLGDNSQLSYQWQPEAKTQALAAHLRNCALSFSYSGQSHIALLRQPARVDGIALNLEKSVAKEDWSIDTSPDPSAIRVEITGVQGAKYKVDPATTINADKGEAWVQFEEGGGLLSLQVETSFKRSFQVSLTPHVKLTPNGKPQRLNIRAITQNKTQLQQGVVLGQRMVQQYSQALKSKQVPEDRKRREIQPRLATFKSELESAEAKLQKVVDFEKMVNDVSLTVNLRVFFDADATEVDLLHIGG